MDAPHLLTSEELFPPPAMSSPREVVATSAAAAAAKAAAKVAASGEGGAPAEKVKDCLPSCSPISPSSRGDDTQQRRQHDREGARTWWRCDPEERERAKAVKGMTGRCEWKVRYGSMSVRYLWYDMVQYRRLW